MNRLGFISDLHYDLYAKYAKGIDANMFMDKLVGAISKHKLTHLFIAGDIANDYRYSEAFVKSLSERLPNVTIKYVFGNHEYYGDNIDYAGSLEFNSEFYFNNKYLELDKHIVLGFNGWYDYTLSKGHLCNNWKDHKEYAILNKQRVLNDRFINTSKDDSKVMEDVLVKLNRVLSVVSDRCVDNDKDIIIFTHFLPVEDKELFEYHGEINYDFVSYLGSKRLHNRWVLNPFIKQVVFGHTHKACSKDIEHIKYVASPLKYYRENGATPDNLEDLMYNAIYVIEDK